MNNARRKIITDLQGQLAEISARVSSLRDDVAEPTNDELGGLGPMPSYRSISQIERTMHWINLASIDLDDFIKLEERIAMDWT